MGDTMLVFEPDLMFSSRIENAGRKLGWSVEVKVSFDQVLESLNRATPKVLLVNLDALGSNSKSLSSLPQGASRLVGYYSHVDSTVAKEALANGFDRAIPRRAFFEELGKLLTESGSSG